MPDRSATVGATIVLSNPIQRSPSRLLTNVTINQIPPGRILSANSVYTPGGIYLFILSAALFWWLCSAHVSILPFWAPWDFSWIEFLTTWLILYWYIRGVASDPTGRPSVARQVAFCGGVLSLYIVVETHFEYLAEHQFFYNRLQHVVLHHFGPVVIALAWPGTTLSRGMPIGLRYVVDHPLIISTIRVLQQPILAPLLFSGSFFFWLIPAVHFRAMIDPALYTVMNWTMIIEGVLFWCLVLDPRPSPPARTAFAVRGALALAVMFPQIVFGAFITFSSRDLYAFYNLCGRIYPDLGPHIDQMIGGLMVWIPPAMMSVAAILLVLHALYKAEQQDVGQGAQHENANNSRPMVDASQWTGL